MDEFIGPIAPSLTRTDQCDLMLAASCNLLSDGFEHDFGAAAEAMQAWKREKDLHGLAVLDPNAERAEQLPDGVQDLRKPEAQLRLLSAKQSSEWSTKRPSQ